MRRTVRNRGPRSSFVIHLTHAPLSSISPSGYHDNHIVIRWFWAAVERFNNEQRLRLLQVQHVGDHMHAGSPVWRLGVLQKDVYFLFK